MLIPYCHTVQYYETDQMAIVHHSNYIRWFEELGWTGSSRWIWVCPDRTHGHSDPGGELCGEIPLLLGFGEQVRIYLEKRACNGVRPDGGLPGGGCRRRYAPGRFQ